MNDMPRKRLSWGWWLLVIVLWTTIVVLLYPIFGNIHRRPPRSAQCRNNLMQIGLAMHSYENDWGALPPLRTESQRAAEGDAWPDCISEHIKTRGILSCPESPEGLLIYSFNRRLSGRRGAPVEGMVQKEYRFTNAAELVLVFDSVNNLAEEQQPQRRCGLEVLLWPDSVSR